MKKGFTLVELLVVIAMLLILMGAMGMGVSAAHRKARISRATAEVRELTNAILAYENANRQHELPQLSNVEATESALKFLLGQGETGADRAKIGVIFNGKFQGGKMLDPWGIPYRVLIKPSTATISDDSLDNITTTTYVPNFYRLTADEEEVTK